jgi:hypothetical protein
MFRYLKGSLITSAIGLLLGAFVGWEATGTITGALETLFIVFVLGVLEVSLSFDNAVVNASILRDMDALWRRRFMTWGILTAVFGMRVVLPIIMVAALGAISPVEAVRLAAVDPVKYGQILQEAHISVAAFGGAFLAMVGLRYFFDREKEVHWIRLIEVPLARLGRVQSAELCLVLILLYIVSAQLPEHEKLEFLVAGIVGLITYILVDGFGALLQGSDDAGKAIVRSGLSSFLYLEVLDASFSFDGVIGAFALSTNLLVIALGLGIGALFVRSLTLLLVDKGTLQEYRFLEHGAFYAIIALGVTMFMQTFVHIPEAVVGLLGATMIGLAFLSSLRHNRSEESQRAPES